MSTAIKAIEAVTSEIETELGNRVISNGIYLEHSSTSGFFGSRSVLFHADDGDVVTGVRVTVETFNVR